MVRFIGLTLLFLGTTALAFASNITPEIDANAAAGAITLLAGGTLVLRARRNR